MRTVEEEQALYRRFVHSRTRKCVACQRKRAGKDLAEIYEFDDVPGLVAVCKYCKPTITMQQAHELATFGTPQENRMYWMHGPQAPADYSKELPIVNRPEQIPIEELGISEEELEKFERHQFQREEQQRKQMWRGR